MIELGKYAEVAETKEQENYRKIQPESPIARKECREYLMNLFRPKESDDGKTDADVEKKNSEITGIIPRTGGEWAGEAGNSAWNPDLKSVPGDRNGTNPEHKTWEEILKPFNIREIQFKDGAPDFSDIAKGKVEIDDFTDDRDSNFTQADEKMAEQKDCSPEEIEKWRTENRYTWHECRDCRTMLLVPREIHGNISHSGGVSEYKSKSRDDLERGGQW